MVHTGCDCLKPSFLMATLFSSPTSKLQSPLVPAVKFSTFWGITVRVFGYLGKCLHSHVPNEPVWVTTLLHATSCLLHWKLTCFPMPSPISSVDMRLWLSYLPFLVLYRLRSPSGVERQIHLILGTLTWS